MERQSYMIGVNRLFLAEVTEDSETGVTYGTPFAVPPYTAYGYYLDVDIETKEDSPISQLKDVSYNAMVDRYQRQQVGC